MKARIGATHRWGGWPEKDGDVQGLRRFDLLKVHDLTHLLCLSGRMNRLVANPDWQVVIQWNPDMRYRSNAGTTKSAAQDMINSTRALLTML